MPSSAATSSRHIRIHGGGDRRHDAFVHEDPQNFAGRHAGRLRKLADRARQLNGDPLLARCSRARASGNCGAGGDQSVRCDRLRRHRGVTVRRRASCRCSRPPSMRAISFFFGSRLLCRGDASLLPRRLPLRSVGRRQRACRAAAGPSDRAASFLLPACARDASGARRAACCLACRRPKRRPASAGRASEQAARWRLAARSAAAIWASARA